MYSRTTVPFASVVCFTVYDAAVLPAAEAADAADAALAWVAWRTTAEAAPCPAGLAAAFGTVTLAPCGVLMGAPPSAALAGCATPHMPIAHTSATAKRDVEGELDAPGAAGATGAMVDACEYKVFLPLPVAHCSAHRGGNELAAPSMPARNDIRELA
ncbi:hypothetical protein PSAC2689_40028 [Paraburkholderia sacchari]